CSSAPCVASRYPLSLHDALPISAGGDFSRRIRLDDKQGFLRVIAGNIDQLLQATSQSLEAMQQVLSAIAGGDLTRRIDSDMQGVDRKSTRLNSSHVKISYAVFCF